MRTKLRKELGLSQPQLGRFLGVSGRTVQDWEQGRRNMPPIYLSYLAHAVRAKRLAVPLCEGCGEIGRENYCYNGPAYKTLARRGGGADGRNCAVCGAGAHAEYEVLLWENCPHCRKTSPHEH